MVAASPAAAGPGYELDPVKPSISLGAEIPHGVAIDQSSQAIYVTELTTALRKRRPRGRSSNSSSTARADRRTRRSAPGEQDFFTRRRGQPGSRTGIYAYQTKLSTPLGSKGTFRMNIFSSAGALGTSFISGQIAPGPQLAADSSGRVYFPNDANGTVQIFSSDRRARRIDHLRGAARAAPSASRPSVAFDSAGKALRRRYRKRGPRHQVQTLRGLLRLRIGTAERRRAPLRSEWTPERRRLRRRLDGRDLPRRRLRLVGRRSSTTSAAALVSSPRRSSRCGGADRGQRNHPQGLRQPTPAAKSSGSSNGLPRSRPRRRASLAAASRRAGGSHPAAPRSTQRATC